MGKKLTAKEIVKISKEMINQGFDICSVCGEVELHTSMTEVSLSSDNLICDECKAKLTTKKFEVQVTRYYVVTDTIEVIATTEEDAAEKAEMISDNKDYTGQLGLDHVTSEIV